jgi:hypothetical protein
MMPGGARQYVETGPAMNWGKWIERFREGRNFVTNGPLLTFNVNGEPMGAVIRIPGGRPYRAKLSAEISSQVPLRRVEFIQNGNVIEGQDVPEGARSFRMEKEVAVESSCWFSVRVDGPPARGVYDDTGVVRAHSGAIYIDVDGQPTLLKEDIELMIRWVDRLWDLLEERNNFGSGGNRQTARQVITRAREHYQAKLVKAR